MALQTKTFTKAGDKGYGLKLVLTENSTSVTANNRAKAPQHIYRSTSSDSEDTAEKISLKNCVNIFKIIAPKSQKHADILPKYCDF